MSYPLAHCLRKSEVSSIRLSVWKLYKKHASQVGLSVLETRKQNLGCY
mgnify:FL=1|jgi:hypothetical protein